MSDFILKIKSKIFGVVFNKKLLKIKKSFSLLFSLLNSNNFPVNNFSKILFIIFKLYFVFFDKIKVEINPLKSGLLIIKLIIFLKNKETKNIIFSYSLIILFSIFISNIKSNILHMHFML